MRPELRCNVTLPAAVDAADANQEAARVGNVHAPLKDFANYFVNATNILWNGVLTRLPFARQ